MEIIGTLIGACFSYCFGSLRALLESLLAISDLLTAFVEACEIAEELSCALGPAFGTLAAGMLLLVAGYFIITHRHHIRRFWDEAVRASRNIAMRSGDATVPDLAESDNEQASQPSDVESKDDQIIQPGGEADKAWQLVDMIGGLEEKLR